MASALRMTRVRDTETPYKRVRMTRSRVKDKMTKKSRVVWSWFGGGGDGDVDVG